jgi:hypothetical protein
MGVDQVSIDPRRLEMLRSFAFAMLIGMVVAVSPAQAAETVGRVERHCVIQTTGVEADGRLITGAQDCFETFSEAMFALSEGSIRLPYDAPVTILESSPDARAAAASFTLGIHYDYSNGGGSSISVVGSSCAGGWWNTPSWFDNRESSSYNGCYRLKHWDYAGAAGSYQSTLTVGQTDNLTYMSNRVESVSYHSS